MLYLSNAPSKRNVMYHKNDIVQGILLLLATFWFLIRRSYHTSFVLTFPRSFKITYHCYLARLTNKVFTSHNLHRLPLYVAIFLLFCSTDFPFFHCLPFPGRSAEISLSEVSGGILPLPPPPACYATACVFTNTELSDFIKCIIYFKSLEAVKCIVSKNDSIQL